MNERTTSGTTNNFTRGPGSRLSGMEYGAHNLYPNDSNRVPGSRRSGHRYGTGSLYPNDLNSSYGAPISYPNDWNRYQPEFPRLPTWNGDSGVLQELGLLRIGDRVRTNNWGQRLPDPEDMDIGIYHRPRQSIPESPPTFTEQMRYMQELTQEVESRLTQYEQRKALMKLKKQIYNPIPKMFARRVSQYYRENANSRNKFEEKKIETDEDIDKCAVCLNDFEPKELVMLTPCDHMYHEECIVPWVTRHGHCPVCRGVCE